MGIVREYKIGDTIAFSAVFLRSIVDYSKSSADRRGVISKIVELGEGFTILECKCGWYINSRNVRLVKNGVVQDE